ncbi:MAG: transglutaminase-like domain-containing protein [Deltaproteobacteria bacterium]|nr:transglutaminase-like domain-containing protein [Deltaproteobacteria bacterium]
MRKAIYLCVAIFVVLSSVSVIYAQETLKKEKVISEEYYDLLFDKNKVGKVRLESYISKFKGKDVYVIEEEMNAVFLRGGTEMKTYSKSRTLSNMKDLSPIGYWYEASEGNVKRTVIGLVSKDRKSIDINIDIGGTKTTKKLDITPDTIFSNAFEYYIRRNLNPGFSKKLPLIMEADADIVEGFTQLEKFEPIDLCPNSVYKTTTMVAGIKNIELRDSSGWPVCVILPAMNAVFLRVDKKKADEGFAPIDIFEQSLIKPDKAIKSLNRLEKLTLKLTFSSIEVPQIIEDEYQKITKKEGKSVILEIQRIRPDMGKKVNFPIKDEKLKKFIEPTRYEQSTSEQIMELAQKFVGEETDAAEAAIKISNQVGQYIKGASLSKGYLSALEVYEQKVGDCTEYSVLTSALLKSLGIPTRLVMGLVYVDGKFGFHSWLDYWADGWYSVDPTLNEESVNPTHIRLWTGIGEPSELRGASTSALSFLNKVKIEILNAEYK